MGFLSCLRCLSLLELLVLLEKLVLLELPVVLEVLFFTGGVLRASGIFISGLVRYRKIFFNFAALFY